MSSREARKAGFGRPVNYPLILGLILVIGLIVIAAFGPMIAPHDPLETFYIIQLPNGEFRTAPYAPGDVPDFPLGTDFDGRDLLSRILWGVRPTLILTFLVATVRLPLGVALGFIEGWYGGFVGEVISSMRRLAMGVPILFGAIIVIYLFGYRLEAWMFIIALTVTGWAPTTKVMAERARLVREEAFIEASRALGAGNIRLLVKHLLPQVRTLILVTWAFELSAALLQLAELGFLGYFVGGGEIRLVPSSQNAGFDQSLIAGRPELGQMMAGGWENITLVPWMTFTAATVVFISILAFLMLGEGLKRYYASGAGAVPVRRRPLFARRRQEAVAVQAKADGDLVLPMPKARDIIRP